VIQHQETLRKSVAMLAPITELVRCNEDRLETYLAEVARRDEQPTHDPTLSRSLRQRLREDRL
jgi:hypothetical protein